MSTAEENDRKSKPLRDAVMKWLRDHNLGGCHRWDGHAWQIDIDTTPQPLLVTVREDGSRAFVTTTIPTGSLLPAREARTPRGLLRVLDRMLVAK